MSASTSSSSLFFHTRRFLLHPPLPTATPPPPPPPPPSAVSAAISGLNATSSSSSEQYPGDRSFDANVVMVLSVLLCALICSLGLNSIIRCALRCSSFVSTPSSSAESRSDSGSAQSSAAANTGVKKKALKTFPTVSFSTDLNLPGLDGECAICLSEFAASDRLRLLPKCNHGFHARCIDKWLNSHSSCPKCRQNLLETCQKIVGSSSEQVPTAVRDSPAVVLAVSPLEPEGPTRSFGGNS